MNNECVSIWFPSVLVFIQSDFVSRVRQHFFFFFKGPVVVNIIFVNKISFPLIILYRQRVKSRKIKNEIKAKQWKIQQRLASFTTSKHFWQNAIPFDATFMVFKF